MTDLNVKQHNLILDNRKKLSISGACDVIGFNEETVSIITSMGNLIIRGASLHINKLDLDSGEIVIDGVINSLQYSESKESKSLIKKIFS